MTRALSRLRLPLTGEYSLEIDAEVRVKVNFGFWRPTVHSWAATRTPTTTPRGEDAYKNGGSGNVGTIVGHHNGGDSAIWTGH